MTADLALSGAAAGNYSLSSDSAEATADITAKPITGSFTAEDKIYDGTTDAGVTGRSLDDTILGDAVSLTGGTATFDTKNVGQDKTVTLTGAALSGTDATNYSLTSVATTTASITPRDTIIGSFTVADKTYDGTTAATITGRSLAGTVPSDDVTLTGGSATFDDKNVGTGQDRDRDRLHAQRHGRGQLRAWIRLARHRRHHAKEITGSFAADDKTYDGDTSATVTTGSRALSGTVSGDDVSLTGGSATFDDRNVGVDKEVTLTGAALSGADAGNYDLTSVATTTADITAKEITGSFAADDKTYDGDTSATVTTGSRCSQWNGVGRRRQPHRRERHLRRQRTSEWTRRSPSPGRPCPAPMRATTTLDLGRHDHRRHHAKEITGSFAADDKTYDGNADAHGGEQFAAWRDRNR